MRKRQFRSGKSGQTRSYSESGVRTDISVRSLHKLLEAVDTPRSLAVWLMFENNEHGQILDLESKPTNYQCPCKFRDDYLLGNLLSKAKFLSLDVDQEQVAIESFRAAEASCLETNRRLRNLGAQPEFQGECASVISTAAHKIAKVLGEFDPNEWFDKGAWGPGASTSVKRDTSAEEKFRRSVEITYPLHELVRGLLTEAYPLWFEADTRLSIVSGNKVTFVPKNAKTHRSIAIEPDLNIWFQLSLGKMMRSRIWSGTGINLKSQRDNQSAARLGSITGLLATLDFKAASDTISREVVKLLIQNQVWFEVLDICRSRHGTLNGEQFRWEKFSSMGNGFTFELETLIFWGLAAASCEVVGVDPCVRVYGDDVILPTEAVALFHRVSKFLGFTLNEKKSFSTGPFRESCGVHYFDGVDCQPIYIKDEITSVPEVFKAANRVLHMANRHDFSDVRRSAMRDYHRLLVMSVPQRFRVGVPKQLGDVGFMVDESNPSCDAALTPIIGRPSDFGWEGSHVRIYGPQSIPESGDHRGVLLCRLQAAGLTSDDPFGFADGLSVGGNSYAIRDRTRFRFTEAWVREEARI